MFVPFLEDSQYFVIPFCVCGTLLNFNTESRCVCPREELTGKKTEKHVN